METFIGNKVEYDQLENVRLEMGFRILPFTNEEVLENWKGVDEQLAKSSLNPFFGVEGSIKLIAL